MTKPVVDTDDDLDTRARNRSLWSQVNADFTDTDAQQMWTRSGVSWGLFRQPEGSLQLLGDLTGSDVLEIGCGTAYLSAWLTRAGARVVALDLSPEQLVTAQRCQDRFGPHFPLVEGDGATLPFRNGSFDLVVSEYGASPWCDPARWPLEAARVLRPGGRLVFLTNSVLAAMCVPAEGGPAGTTLLRGATDVNPVSWPGGGVEYHPGHGEWIRRLADAGFVVDALHELEPPDQGPDHEYYEIVTRRWSERWPAEDVWVAHRPRVVRSR